MKVATSRWYALRSAKHDVVAIAEVSPRAEDDDVRERAVSDERILITEDKDFGQLVYASMRRTGGVVFGSRRMRGVISRWPCSIS
jgi:predicted nuclease of predicted toxin-antitoxin system